MNTQGFVGDLLIRGGAVDGLALDLDAHSRQMLTFGQTLAALSLTSKSAVAAGIASALQLEHLDGEPPEVDAAVAALLPGAFCHTRRAAPLGLRGNVLRLAVTDPMDCSVLQDVEFRTGKKAVAVVVTQTWFETLFGRLYPDAALAAIYDVLHVVKSAGEVEATADLEYDPFEIRSRSGSPQ